MRHGQSTAIALLAIAVGCGQCGAEPPAPRRPPPEELPGDAGRPPVIGPPMRDAGTVTDAGRPRRHVPAIQPDTTHQGTDPVTARRLVYRVTLTVPGILGHAPEAIAPPVGELYVDVSADRLRARFAGQGWPIAAGSEVRIRRDLGGVYAIDGDGGRPLAPGQLAAWFDGGRGRGSRTPVRVRVESREAEAPGDLVCALLAEWSRQHREAVVRRCQRRSPISFRIGPWLAERTADVPVELPEESLRADEQSPSTEAMPSPSRAFLAPAMLGRVSPVRPPPPPRGPPSAEGPGEGLRVTNGQPTRVIVVVQGVPIGFVDAGTTAHFVGLGPGIYYVGALRPLGGIAARPRLVPVPTDLTL